MLEEYFFVYVINSGSLAAGASTQTTTIFSSTTDFLLSSIRTSGSTGVTLLISLSDGQQFSTAPLLSSLIGNVNNQGITFEEKVFIPRGTTLKITFNNNDSAVHTEEVQLWGSKTS